MVARPTLKEADLKKLLETVKSWLGKVKIVKEEDQGQKALSYTIKKEVAGHYFMFQLEGESIAKDFEERVIRQDQIIRHLMLRTK